ncbi:hypothetical protein HPP92_004667 [Vanilla planifolia]|uniref:Uncharacterized protein n=1 Tax=Vanilla planifolia TaxID=51239 RepID=A0A835RHA8_VANPL|nr:hypothetical protein HPP92_004667 [Vanilla planifolia]
MRLDHSSCRRKVIERRERGRRLLRLCAELKSVVVPRHCSAPSVTGIACRRRSSGKAMIAHDPVMGPRQRGEETPQHMARVAAQLIGRDRPSMGRSPSTIWPPPPPTAFDDRPRARQQYGWHPLIRNEVTWAARNHR